MVWQSTYTTSAAVVQLRETSRVECWICVVPSLLCCVSISVDHNTKLRCQLTLCGESVSWWMEWMDPSSFCRFSIANHVSYHSCLYHPMRYRRSCYPNCSQQIFPISPMRSSLKTNLGKRCPHSWCRWIRSQEKGGRSYLMHCFFGSRH